MQVAPSVSNHRAPSLFTGALTATHVQSFLLYHFFHFTHTPWPHPVPDIPVLFLLDQLAIPPGIERVEQRVIEDGGKARPQRYGGVN